MKKVFIITSALLLIFGLISFAALGVSAHPGRTDSNGGHTDRDTGEYHYHHGYPAHDHYDMDGDGYLDCPYNFEDITNRSDKNNTVISTETNNNAPTSVQDKEVKKMSTWGYWVIAGLCCAIVVLIFIIKSKNDQISMQILRFRNSLIEEDSRVKAGVTLLHEALVKEYGSGYLYVIAGANPGDFLDKDFLPHSASCLIDPIDDCYTFYLGGYPQSISKYHHRNCRYARSIFPKNAYHLRHRHSYQPCSLCPCRLPDTSWVDRYMALHTFLTKYVDLETERKMPELEKPNPHLGNVSYDMVKEYANHIGLPFDTAQKLINAERKEAGVPPICFEEMTIPKRYNGGIWDDPTLKINWRD